MTRRPFTPPSATSILTAAVVTLAVGFVRCEIGKPAQTPGVPRAPSAPSGAESLAPAETGSASAAAPSASGAPSGSVSATAAEASPPASRRYVVAVVGDSLTDARSGGGKYIDHLAKRCPESRFDNFGKGGDMVNQMRRRFERDVASSSTQYTHLVVFGGVNDLYSDLTAGRTPEKIARDLTAMYAAAKARGWQVVALTVAPWGGFSKYYNASRASATRELNDWLKQQLAAKSVDHVVDAFALLSCGDAERLCPDYAKPYRDGLHFGPAGHEKLGEALLSSVFSNCR